MRLTFHSDLIKAVWGQRNLSCLKIVAFQLVDEATVVVFSKVSVDSSNVRVLDVIKVFLTQARWF